MISSAKFGRTYRLTVVYDAINSLQIVIEPPFTLEIDLTRKQSSDAANCKLRVYNLAEATRVNINKNLYNKSEYRYVILEAGYEGTAMSIIFQGNVDSAYSQREGVNFITSIECLSGNWQNINTNIDIVIPSGTLKRDAIATIMQYVPFFAPGAIGDFPGTIPVNTNYSGNPMGILAELTGNAAFIEVSAGKIHALKNGETAQSIPVITIDASTGLLNTPIMEQNTATVTMLFEPTLACGGAIEVTSLGNSQLNGTYAVLSVKHRGIISPVVSGDMITEATFYYIAKINSIPDYLAAGSGTTA